MNFYTARDLCQTRKSMQKSRPTAKKRAPIKMLVVIDTNILVSALWSRNDGPAKIIAMALNNIIKPCYDYCILSEYRDVLMRPKFEFAASETTALLALIGNNGLSVVASLINMAFDDEEDRKFYEVAQQCHATLIAGNLKHLPKDDSVLSVSDFMRQYISG